MSLQSEHQTLLSGAGLLDRGARVELLDMTGEDRVRFLNGQVTCDVATLRTGHAVYGLFVSPKGRVEADVTVLALDDRLRLELPAGRGTAIRERLEKYALVDRVHVVPADGLVPLTLVGPEATAVLRKLDVEPPEPWAHRDETVTGHDVCLDRRPLHGMDAVTLWVDEERDRDELMESLVGAGAEPVGFEALDAARVEAGRPRFGVDFGPDNFPQETGVDRLDDAVSYTKGCYLGQEVVARIHYRGGVNKHLCTLRITGEAPEPGTSLEFEGREAGTLGSVSPRVGEEGARAGLAILHKRAAVAGAVLEAPEGEGARIEVVTGAEGGEE